MSTKIIKNCPIYCLFQVCCDLCCSVLYNGPCRPLSIPTKAWLGIVLHLEGFEPVSFVCLVLCYMYKGPLSPPQADWEDEEDENNYASSQPRVLRRRNSEYPGKEKTQSERKNIKELKNCKHENLKIQFLTVFLSLGGPHFSPSRLVSRGAIFDMQIPELGMRLFLHVTA